MLGNVIVMFVGVCVGYALCAILAAGSDADDRKGR